MKLQIMIRPVSEFRTRNEIAIHVLEPTFNELIDCIEQAEKDMFPMIVLYSDKTSFGSLKGNSLWNKLRKVFSDVRYGEVTASVGPSCWGIGTGFTLYL